jgi:hypothetical protein
MLFSEFVKIIKKIEKTPKHNEKTDIIEEAIQGYKGFILIKKKRNFNIFQIVITYDTKQSL